MIPGGGAPMFLGGGTRPTPVYIASSTGQTGTNTLAINRPSGTIDGHIMVLVLTSTASSTTPSTGLTGWTLRQANVNIAALGLHYSVYTKIAASEGAAYVITFASSNQVSAYISSYSSPTAGFDAIGTIGTTTSTTGACVAPSVTSSNSGMLIGTWFANYVSGTSGVNSPPSGMTSRVAFASDPSNNSIYVFDQASPSGASGSRSCTLNTTIFGTAGFLIKIN